MKYEADNPYHLELIADRIALLKTEERLVEFLAEAFASGRMIANFQEPGIEDSNTLIHGMLEGHTGRELILFYGLLLMQPDESGQDMYIAARKDLIDHLLNGTDTTPNSTAAGGWNQEELDDIVEMLERAEKP